MAMAMSVGTRFACELQAKPLLKAAPPPCVPSDFELLLRLRQDLSRIVNQHGPLLRIRLR
jgi:hypothetical protein